MAKRVADTYLTDRNYDDDNDANEEVCTKILCFYIRAVYVSVEKNYSCPKHLYSLTKASVFELCLYNK